MNTRLVEFVVVFIGIPLLMLSGLLPFRPIEVLLAATAVVAVLLWADKSFERLPLWNKDAFADHWKAITLRFLLMALLIGGAVWHFTPDRFFDLPRKIPGIWLLLMIAYPLLSVYPQELVYRVFFFYRYAEEFGSERAAVTASALSFGFVHLVFGNWIAVLLSTLGGFLFAWSYRKSSSALVSSFEHALYGQFVFTVGLRHYFYGGTYTEVVKITSGLQ